MKDEYMELLKSLRDKSRKHIMCEMNGQFKLILDFDGLKFTEAIEILDDVRGNVPKLYKGKPVRVYIVGVLQLG